MGRPSVEIEGQVFEPKQMGRFREVIKQVALAIHTDKVGWSFPDPSSWRRVVEGTRLQTFYGELAAKAFDQATEEKPWRWQCIGVEPVRRKVLVLNP